MIITGAGPLWLFIVLRLCEFGSLIFMTVLWLRGMQRAIESCHPLSRSGDPNAPWMTFIPIFGLVWQFISVQRTGESVAREYKRRNWSSEEALPGVESGMIACVVVVVVFILRVVFPIHPGFGFIGSIAIGFCMYRHTDRLNAYRERMEKEADPTIAFGQIPFHYPNSYAYRNPQQSSGSYSWQQAPQNFQPAEIAHQFNPNEVNHWQNVQEHQKDSVYSNNLNVQKEAEIPDELQQWMPKKNSK